MVTRRVPLSTAQRESVVPTGSARRSIDRRTWLVSHCTKRIYLPAHIFLKPVFKFAMRTVAVAATATSNASVVPTGSAGRSIDKRTWLVSHIFLKPTFKFAMRTVAVAATATVSDERCSLEDDWHIKKRKHA